MLHWCKKGKYISVTEKKKSGNMCVNVYKNSHIGFPNQWGHIAYQINE